MKLIHSQMRLGVFFDSPQDLSGTPLTVGGGVNPPSHSLSIEEAKEYFELVVRGLAPGTRFTANALFGGVKLRNDKRGWGEVVNHLRRLGLISIVCITRDNQEQRNNGYAALWEVVR